ncbi:Endonuclease/exonuclease/phosphatase [Gymnopilus junonius]|uniref:Endonuclease/exonuclease/phosphatase n=1 Tax=Gymnopilus junonius TaxID=109634 RepID=A0A9P5P2I0_GYMJU|nr:Endonuclease/exonuclease/phosphatase [Gymnopilus junonius]
MRRQDADVLCLQEVDRLEKLLPMLEGLGYSHHYASGPRKLHGCLIAFKEGLFTMLADKVIFYDDQSMGIDSESSRIGSSFKTRNIGYLLALQNNSNAKEGMVVATSHLFWHPRYTYERIRQLAILLREVVAFRKGLSADRWPCILAGDFNFSPADPAYSLATGDPLLVKQEETITPSLVVHSSRDPRILENPKAAVEDESEDADPDRVITNARPATAEDGLLSIPELVDWFSVLPTLRSAYSDGLHEALRRGYNLPTYGTRVSLAPGRRGSDEPEYTSYTHYWQAVLDYIFFIDSPERPISVLGLLTPLSGPDLHPGLPQKRVSGSDHTCLVTELCW